MSRRRARIAMAGVPIVSHVLPGLALVRELVGRGDRGTYANDPFVADRIESAGAEPVPCISTLPVADNDWPADPVAAASPFPDDAVHDGDPAGLHLHDIGAYAARALAGAQGRPPPCGCPRRSSAGTAVRRKSRPVCGSCRAPTRTGTGPHGGSPTAVRPPRTWARSPARPGPRLIPRAMQPHADRVDAGTATLVGPCFGTRADADGWLPGAALIRGARTCGTSAGRPSPRAGETERVRETRAQRRRPEHLYSRRPLPRRRIRSRGVAGGRRRVRPCCARWRRLPYATGKAVWRHALRAGGPGEDGTAMGCPGPVRPPVRAGPGPQVRRPAGQPARRAGPPPLPRRFRARAGTGAGPAGRRGGSRVERLRAAAGPDPAAPAAGTDHHSAVRRRGRAEGIGPGPRDAQPWVA
ncbi:hypothetical protein SUDANB6_00523 [Streptomyces sp. enrichment culture]